MSCRLIKGRPLSNDAEVLSGSLCSNSLFLRCPAFKRLREEAEKKKRPSWNEFKGSKSEGDLADAKSTPIARTAQLSGPSEPGLVNPAFEEGEDGIASFFFFFFFLVPCPSNIITKSCDEC